MREEARRRTPAVLFLSAGLVACALAAGLHVESGWLTELLVILAVGQGLAAGLALPAYWREGRAPGRGRSPPWSAEGSGGTAAGGAGVGTGTSAAVRPSVVRVLMGAGGRYAAFLAAVAFAAVEAHAVGAGLGRGAPPVALTLLLPPVVVGAILLRGALVRLPQVPEGSGEVGDGGGRSDDAGE